MGTPTFDKQTEYTGVYRIAEVPVRISSHFSDVHRMCREYVSDEMPKYDIVTIAEDIYRERRYSEAEAAAEGRSDFNYSDGYLETLAVYRKIADCFLAEGVLLFHGSAIAVDGRAYIFAAKSGIGKSTHARLWREYLGDRAVMINDDKPLIRIENDRTIVCGTPWNGKHRLGTNIVVPLKAICFLQRGEQNSIRRITPQMAFPKLLEQTYRPPTPEQLTRVLLSLDSLARTTEFYSLICNMDPEAAAISFGTMGKVADN